MLGVKRGAIYSSSTPPDPVLTPGMSHEITPFWKSRGGKKEESGCSFKNKYKTLDPRVFFPWCIAVYYPLWHETLSQRLGLRFTSHKLSVSWGHADRGMGVNNGHPQRGLIEDNNTPILIRTQTRGRPTKSARMIVCVSECRHAHAYMNMTHDASMRTHISTHLYNLCLLSFGPVDQNKAAERLYMQPCGWRLNSGFKMQGVYRSQCTV